MIYPLLLEGEDQQDYTTLGYQKVLPPLRFDYGVHGLYKPFSYVRLPRNNRANNSNECDHEARLIMHASPPVLMLNKQIRKEAKSLYLQQYLTVSLYGVDKEDGEAQVKSFKQWLKTLDSTEVAEIRRIELREHVWLPPPEDEAKVRAWGAKDSSVRNIGLSDYLNGLQIDEGWHGDLATMELSIQQNGRVLEVRSRLEVVERATCGVKSYLQALACAKQVTGDVFNGQDLVGLTCWMRTVDKVLDPGWLWWTPVAVLIPRWIMISSKDEIEDSDGELIGSKIKLGFRHLVARAELEDGSELVRREDVCH